MIRVLRRITAYPILVIGSTTAILATTREQYALCTATRLLTVAGVTTGKYLDRKQSQIEEKIKKSRETHTTKLPKDINEFLDNQRYDQSILDR
jgi:GTPase